MCYFVEKWVNYVEVEEPVLQEGDMRDPAKALGPKKPEKHSMEGKTNKAQVTYVESATELFVVLMGEEKYDQVSVFYIATKFSRFGLCHQSCNFKNGV